jgi:RNA polymerase sigma-70 factor (ECF subfamily)
LQGLLKRDDNEIIALVIQGNRRAYEVIVLRYQKLVFNVIYQIVKQKESAADLTQDTFVKAFQALNTFRQGAALRPWILRIASNTALNHIRSAKPYQSLEQLLEDLPGQEPASDDDVAKNIEQKMNEEKLMEILETLQPQHRHLFLLRYQHDLSYEDIGTVLELPVTTIKSLLFRVRSKVRLLMSREFTELNSHQKLSP